MTEVMADVRKEVTTAAERALADCCGAIGNRDIEVFIPTLVSCMARPVEVSETVERLAATTFVQSVEPPALALMVPVLQRGLAERATAVKRKASIIIDNMCKLVAEPSMVAPFLPKLLPGLERVKEETSDPECRQVAARAFATLRRAAGDPTGTKVPEVILKAVHSEVLDSLHAVLAEALPSAPKPSADPVLEAALSHVAGLAAALIDAYDFETRSWSDNVVTPYLEHLLGGANTSVLCSAFYAKSKREAKNPRGTAIVEEDEGEDLCNCEFSLAYGGKILLNSARLHLKRGRRYGLCGPNGVGKSTLMRAISNGQLEGFPPADVLRTVYVEHDIQADAADYSVVDYVLNDAMMKGTERSEIVKTLGSVGFTAEMQAAPITSLSGGWKMKLALARAMLLKADILLLDEPTNHLDKINVAWLINYLLNLTECTSMIVSHDSTFLDTVCTDIIHYEGFKLKRYKGNLSQFVKVYPPAASYYSLAATTITWKFPEPGYLEGVKTKDKAILKMQKVDFKYPTSEKQTLADVTIYVSLSSRVAVLGANGAGKSTMIKLLTGELLPDKGLVWKHPNLRLAYVAQHAFHHLEKHLEETPSEYIQWRFATGEDREAEEKATAKISEEEEKKMAEKVSIGGQKLVVNEVLSRRKLKNSYEYEVSWVGQPVDKNSWLPRRQLEEMGFGKLVDAVDSREAAAAGLHSKPLTAANIAKHLEGLGLEPEFSLHSRMKGLSGGQKVKVVLGAATWMNPHVLVLDEPTNYLDRDSLGALTAALNDFGGGVVIISHQFEFTNAICKEKWLVENGTLTTEGEAWAVPTKILGAGDQPDEVMDAAGNIIAVKKVQKLSKQDMKRKIKEKAKLRKERLKRGESIDDISDDEEMEE